MTPIIPVRSAGLLSAAVRDRVRLTGTSSVLIGVAAAVLAWLAVVILATRTGLPWVTGQDAIAYWSMSIADPYARAEWTTPGAFVYSPAFAQLIAPLAALPWLTFIALWTALQLLAVRHLAGPRLLAIGVVVAAAEIAGGNISLFLAVAIVVGFRWPAAWAFVVLTKVTPAVALLWFAVRGEWRSFAIATGATALVVAVSAVIAPGAWVEWLDVLGRSAGRDATWAAVPVPLVVRLPLAIALVVWGARTDRRWVVPVAAMLALPALWYGGLSMLLAVLILNDADRVRARDGS